VRLVVGFSRGSASDDIAKTIKPAFERALGQEVVIELEPGDNGADAARGVASAPPDGGLAVAA
jgi:tripartite-type tricarboxylate transporter receptor subunit TctC